MSDGMKAVLDAIPMALERYQKGKKVLAAAREESRQATSCLSDCLMYIEDEFLKMGGVRVFIHAPSGNEFNARVIKEVMSVRGERVELAILAELTTRECMREVLARYSVGSEESFLAWLEIAGYLSPTDLLVAHRGVYFQRKDATADWQRVEDLNSVCAAVAEEMAKGK